MVVALLATVAQFPTPPQAVALSDRDDRIADTGTARQSPRTIVTTDPELDDLNSLLRMLLYSNEMQIEGLVYSASQFHYSGDPALGLPSKRWPDSDDVFHIDRAATLSARRRRPCAR